MAEDKEQRAAGDDKPDVITKAKKFRKRSRTHFANWRTEAKEDYDFFAGNQWSEEDKSALKEQLRPVVTFNRVGPVVDAVSGSEVSNRQEVRYIPRQLGDVGVNELLTGAAEWVRDECDAEDEESDAFVDTVVCGLGVTETRMDYDDDPEGKVLIERTDPLEMDPDPSARKRNLCDGKELGRLKWIERSEVAAMWPDKKDEIALLERDDWKDFDAADQPDKVDPGDDYDTPDASGSGEVKKDRIPVYEYQYCVRRTVYVVADPGKQATFELPEAKFRRLSERARKVGLTLKYVRQQRKTYRRAFMCGDVLLEDDECPCPYSFTYKFITGKRDRNTNTWYGLVRAMKDPQRWANKFFSQILHIINSNAKGGAFVEKGALSNPRKAEEDWSNPAALILLNDGAVAKGAIKERQSVTYPAGLDRMMEFAVSSIRDVTGVNLEMLGLADRQQAGVLEYQRKQAGLTILASLFDGLRRYRKEQGRLLLHFIQTYISDSRLIRITGGDGKEQYVPLVRQPETYKFDVIVDDAPTSPNQKEKTWGILTQLLPMVGEVIPPEAWPEILRYSPLPESFTQKMLQALEKAQQNPQPSPEQQALEIKRQEAEMQAQTRAQESQQKIQLAEAEFQHKAMLAEQEMALKVREQEHEFALADRKMHHELQVKDMMAQQEAAIRARTAEQDAQIKAQSAAVMDDAKAKAIKTKAKQKPAAKQG